MLLETVGGWALGGLAVMFLFAVAYQSAIQNNATRHIAMCFAIVMTLLVAGGLLVFLRGAI